MLPIDQVFRTVQLQQRLGHASIKTTEIYLAFLTPEEKRAVMFGMQNESLKESQV